VRVLHQVHAGLQRQVLEDRLDVVRRCEGHNSAVSD
jgi:hypothetical protein